MDAAKKLEEAVWGEKFFYSDVLDREKMVGLPITDEFAARCNYPDLYAHRKLAGKEPELSETAKDVLRLSLAFLAYECMPFECTAHNLMQIVELMETDDLDDGCPRPVVESAFGCLFRESIEGLTWDVKEKRWKKTHTPKTSGPVYEAWQHLMRNNSDRMIYESREELAVFIKNHEALIDRLMRVENRAPLD